MIFPLVALTIIFLSLEDRVFGMVFQLFSDKFFQMALFLETEVLNSQCTSLTRSHLEVLGRPPMFPVLSRFGALRFWVSRFIGFQPLGIMAWVHVRIQFTIRSLTRSGLYNLELVEIFLKHFFSIFFYFFLYFWRYLYTFFFFFSLFYSFFSSCLSLWIPVFFASLPWPVKRIMTIQGVT